MAFKEFLNLPENVRKFRIELFDCYQRANAVVKKAGKQLTHSQRACHFLASATFLHADAAILLADEDLFPSALSLLRTCIEAQARACYIVNLQVSEREQKAKSFNDLVDLDKALECEDVLQSIASGRPRFMKDAPQDLEDRCKIIIAKVKPLLQGDTVRKRLKKLERLWSFASVTEAMSRIPADRIRQQPLQGVEIYWRLGCRSVHASPSSFLFNSNLNLVAEIALRTSLSSIISLVWANESDPNKELVEAAKLVSECYPP